MTRAVTKVEHPPKSRNAMKSEIVIGMESEVVKFITTGARCRTKTKEETYELLPW
jgi:hypothetical protein